LRQATLQLPYFHERNFAVGEDFSHSVLIESKSPLKNGERESLGAAGGVYSLQMQLTDNALSTAESTVMVPRDGTETAWAYDKPAGTGFIQQTLQLLPVAKPDTLVVVVDSSASMASSAESIAQALSSLSARQNLFLILADDQIDARSLQSLSPLDATSMIRGYEYVGGKDNTAALAQALDTVLGAQQSALVWIHGPQPVSLQNAAALEQRLERRGPVRWYDIQVAPGSNRIVESLDGVAPIHTLSLAQLPRLFSLWQSGGNQIVTRRERVSSTEPPDRGEEQTSDHLARLWANDEVQRLLYKEHASRQSIIELAHQYQLVTPVTGAVVLETQQQYDEAGLTRVPEGTVPSIPEPEEWALIVIALCVLVYAFHRRRVAQHAPV
jgi:hypothetical protein